MAPSWGSFPPRPPPRLSPPPLRALLVWSARRALPALSLTLRLPCVPPRPAGPGRGPPDSAARRTLADAARTLRPAVRRGSRPAAAHGVGEPGRREHRAAARGRGLGPQPGSALRNPGTPAPGLAMAAPRPPRAISVSAPVFYAPQRSSPRWWPEAQSESLSGPATASRLRPLGPESAQMGRVGEIPPPPPEGRWPSLGAGPRRAPYKGGEGFGNSGMSGKVAAEGWAQTPSPEQMFLAHHEARGWEPGLLGQFQVPRLGVRRRECGSTNVPLWVRFSK